MDVGGYTDLIDQELSCTVPGWAHSCWSTGGVYVPENSLIDIKVDLWDPTGSVYNASVALVCE